MSIYISYSYTYIHTCVCVCVCVCVCIFFFSGICVQNNGNAIRVYTHTASVFVDA